MPHSSSPRIIFIRIVHECAAECVTDTFDVPFLRNLYMRADEDGDGRLSFEEVFVIFLIAGPVLRCILF